jgi:hypothetical protein
MEAIPRIKCIIKTSIYVDDLRATEAFQMVLGLPVINKEPGHHVFFQVGEASVLFAFPAKSLLPAFGPAEEQVKSVCGPSEFRNLEQFPEDILHPT